MSETVFAADPTRLLIAALVRASVGAAVVAMTMAAGIMASMPAVAELSPLYRAAMVCAITGGATAFSHVNDSGFWLVSSLLEIDEKTTLKSWTMMETIIGFTGLHRFGWMNTLLIKICQSTILILVLKLQIISLFPGDLKQIFKTQK